MISIKNLSFAHKKKLVFEGLDLDFQPGFIYGIFGKNGSGKSSLLRNIAGLLFPYAGSILVNGFNPRMRDPDFLQNMFFVPEEIYIRNISVSELLNYYAPFYPMFSRDQFYNYISVFDIPTDSTLQDISYGQKKKVIISFALASNTSILLMDEPTNGLDITGKSQLRKILAEALDEQRCVIVSTHEVKDLENLIDHVTILEEGKILFNENIRLITQKLSFRYAHNKEELETAFYREMSLGGHAIVAPNEQGEDGRLDLELLYKAIITNSSRINNLFQRNNL